MSCSHRYRTLGRFFVPLHSIYELDLPHVARPRCFLPVQAWWSHYEVSRLPSVYSPPSFIYHSRILLREPSYQVDRLWIMDIVEYFFLVLLNIIAAAQEGLLVHGRSADGRIGTGGKVFPLPYLFLQLPDRLWFFDILYGTSIY